MAETFSARAAHAVPAAQAGHLRTGSFRPLVFRQREKPLRHPAALPFRRGARAAMVTQIVQSLLILALAQFIAMPLRGLNTVIKQHFAPHWTTTAAQPRR